MCAELGAAEGHAAQQTAQLTALTSSKSAMALRLAQAALLYCGRATWLYYGYSLANTYHIPTIDTGVGHAQADEALTLTLTLSLSLTLTLTLP